MLDFSVLTILGPPFIHTYLHTFFRNNFVYNISLTLWIEQKFLNFLRYNSFWTFFFNFGDSENTFFL